MHVYFNLSLDAYSRSLIDGLNNFQTLYKQIFVDYATTDSCPSGTLLSKSHLNQHHCTNKILL